MRFKLKTAPTSEPVTTAEAKAQASVFHTADDALIEQYIKAARELLESETARQYVTATWEQYFDEFPDVIEITKLPVASIVSVKYVDTDGDTQTMVVTTEYQVDYASPNRPCRILPAYGAVWPATRAQPNAVTVNFTAGYGTADSVPATAKQAILMLAAHFYENREPVADRAKFVVPLGLQYLVSNQSWGQYG